MIVNRHVLKQITPKPKWHQKSFLDFLKEFDLKMAIIIINVLLFIDQCPAYPSAFSLLISYIFFPVNSTSWLQQFDLGLPLKWENEIPWLFLVFLVNFQISRVFPVFQVAWQPLSMDLPLRNTEHIVAVTLKHNRSRKFYAIGNHILLFSVFLATFLITTF